MRRTHNEAMAAFMNGNVDAAWDIAKQDEGLNEGATKDAWVAFAKRCAKTERQVSSAYAAAY